MAHLGLHEILSYAVIGLTALRLVVVLVAIPVVWVGALLMFYMMVRSVFRPPHQAATYID